MQDNKNFLAAEPIGKLLLKLSIPTVIAQLINMLYNIVDRIYIGHIPSDGSLALTGVGVCMPIIMIVTAFAALVSSGGAPRASIYMGKQDNESAENILGNCFLLQIVISLILTAILLIWSKDLLLAFGASENTISYATDYMHIYAFGTLFVQLTLGMNAFITAQGFTTISMVSVLIGAICNITLDPVFIFAFHMGVKGAALATVISQAISTIWVVSFLCGEKTHLHLRKKYMRLEPKVFVPCVTLGLAAFIMQASESIVTVCFNSSLLRYGGDIAVGAMTILTSVMQFAMLPLQGIAQGAQLQIVISLILTAILLIWSKDLLLAFGASENTISYATDYMHIYAFGTLFVQLTLGMNAFITAQGFTTISMVSVLIGAICNITLDPVFIFAFHMGVKGAALATVISQAISTIWVVSFLCGEKTHLHLRKKYMRLEPKVFVPCVTLGLAAFIMQASESIVTVCFNSSLLRYGGDIAVGAMTILTSVMQFAMLPLQGIAQGAQPISSYNYGAKNTNRVKKTFRLLLMTCLSYSALLWAAVQLIPRVFVSIFTADASLINFTAPMLRIYLGGLFLFGIQIACQMTFTSLGKAVNSIVVAVVRKFVLLLPLIYIMPHVVSNPTTGVYMAEPIADIIAVLFTSVLFSFQFKKALAEIQNENN